MIPSSGRVPSSCAEARRPNSPGAQRKVFAQKLVAIVDHVDYPAWITREFGELVRTHREYGVTPEMYPWVGEALIETLREACGDAWSPESRTRVDGGLRTADRCGSGGL